MGSTGRAIEKKGNSKSDAANPNSAPSGTGLFMREASLERDQLTAPTPKLPDEFSFLSEYLKDLSEEDWATFCEATADTVTKVQFMSLCTMLMSHVKVSAMAHLLPALMKMLKEDPGRFQSVQESMRYVEPTCFHSKTSVMCIEDERKVIVLKDGVMTRIISKVRNICCSYTFCSADTDTRSPRTLLQELGITEQRVQNNVEETLRKLNLISSTTGSDAISAAIAKEVVLKINSTFVERKTSPSHASNVSAIPSTKSNDELIEDVSLKMNAIIKMSDKEPTTTQAGTSQRAIDSALASAMDGTITAVFNRIDSCLDERNKSAKRWLASIKKVLVCQSGSLNTLPLNAHLTSEQSIKAVSMEEFQIKTKKAISDVLIRKLGGFDFTSASETSFPPSDITTSSDKAVEKINQLPHFCQQPIEETAATVIETFVVKMKTIAQSSKDISSAKAEIEVKTLFDTPVVVYGGRVSQALIAATRIYFDVKMVLKEFFGHLELLTTSPTARCESDPVLPMTTALSSVELRTAHSDTDCLLGPRQLDSCTKNVLKGVLSVYLPGKGQHSPLPSASSSLEDSILFQLSDMASSSSSFLTEDDFSEYLSNLTENDGSEKRTESQSSRCLRRLSSVEFQMNAFEAVTEILAASVQSHMSSGISNETDAFPEIPWAEFSSKDLDVLAMELVMTINDQNTKDSTSSLMQKRPSTSVPETHTTDRFMLPSQHDIACTPASLVQNFKTDESDDTVRHLTEAIQKLSSKDIKTSITKDVSQVLHQSAENFIGQTCPLAAVPTASDVTAEVLEGLTTLLHSTSSAVANTTLDVKGNTGTGLSNLPEPTENNPKDFNFILNMLEGLRGKILKFFTKCQEVGTKLKGNTLTYTKKVISAALVCIKKDLLRSNNLQKSEDIQLIYDILNSMLKNIEEEYAQDDQEMTSVVDVAASSSSHSSSRGSESSDKFLPVSICELTADGSIVKYTYIDMSDQVHSGLPACISRETIGKVVKTVNKKLDLEGQLSRSSPQHKSLHSIALKLEKSVSNSSFSDDLTGKVYRLLKKSSKTAMQKSASDTALLNTRRRNGEVTKKHVASQFVKNYAEETVKHFLLPCFNLQSPYTDKLDSSVPASTSASSQILIDLLNLLTEAMVKDVMSSFAQSDVCQEDQAKEKKKNRRGIFRFLPRIPKVNVFTKKTTSGNRDPSLNHDTVEKHVCADVAAESTNPPSTSKQMKGDQPQKQNLFQRLVTAIRRRKPK